ncbi:CbbQ/NirQ/NorQ/GpvN family protein [Flagellimonas pacifica]|uniref:Nitric oxide reductase NorQ protein n=1 Tax=Flagellimonas pacifica TaxID=1247520 RepID=A0A285MWB8_9FLAO|nr:CbbQ/NirQ/NorQ/GpvN family protein [Allomuricauda parva]SNZ01485.1 nitric oxide reductase NorQ protein [Allomuricauda parva]
MVNTIEEKEIHMTSNTKTAVPYYKPVGKEIAIFKHSHNSKIPFLLKGPTGTGKSRFIEYMAHELDQPLITVSCHEETSSTDLIGRYIIKGAETVWMDGPLTMAVKTGAILYLDEIAEARPDVIVAIHSLTDHRRELFIDKLGKIIKAHPDFMLVASFNPGYQRGFKELKPSTRQRFVAVSFNYPEAKIETDILVNETNILEADAKKLVNIANKIRNLTELGLTETVSTRLLVDAAKLIRSGLPKRLTVHVAVVEPLTDDVEVVSALNDLCDLMI